MATSGTLRPLNSLGGFSVGDNPQDTIILANGDITAGNITADGNLQANYTTINGNLVISNATAGWGVLTDNLYYSNGTPWDMSNPAGSNNYIQYNDNGSFGASANFQFDPTNNILDVVGLANITGNAKVTNTLTANTANITLVLNGNVGNFSGNLTAANANLGTGLLEAGNANITYTINGNVGNFSGNINSLNANLGNLVEANFVNVASNIQTVNLGITGNVTGNLIPSASNTYTLGNSTNMWKDLYLSGTSIYLGAQQITSNAAGVNLSNNVVVANTLQANYVKDLNLSNTQIVYANASNILVGSGNFVFDPTVNTLSVDSANLIGTLNGNVANFTGNLTSLNANLGNLVTANYVNVAANLVVSGNANFTGAANVSLGAVGNLHITGGSAGQVLQTDGSGGLSWSSTANINEIQNGTSNVYIPTADGNITITANGSQTWTFGTDGKLSTAGDIQANGTVNANYITASLGITSSGNINANTGNVNANNANLTNDLWVGANANIVNTLTANIANITTLNVANVSTTGNITANNATINLELSGNTANFSGQVNLNANANVTNNLTVGGNITTSGAGGNITMSGGNINGANVIFANTANISLQLNGANANFTGNISAANFVGTLANGTSNVSVDLNGNISINPGGFGGNAFVFADHILETGTAITATGNITSNSTIIANAFTAYANTGITISAGANTDGGNYNVTLTPTGPNGTVAVSGARITNLATPNAASDAATKQYVDDVAQGLNVHDAANVATTGDLATLTGGTITYNNGTGGDGATLTLSGSPTSNFTDAGTFDTGFTAVATNRVLVRAETNTAYNGVYVVTSSTVLTRAADYNSVPEVEAGDFIFVIAGGTYGTSGWVQTSVVTTMGTSPILFTQFSGAGSYTANTAAGLFLDGTVFNAKVDDITTAFDGSGNIVVKTSAQLTTPNIGAATGTSVDLTGALTANYVNANVSINTFGDINATTGNITGNYVFVQQDLSVTGNIANANNISVTNNITAGSANITNNLQGNTANFSGNLTASNANIGTGLVYAGNANITATLTGNIANFSGNLTSLNANLGNLATANYINVANDLNVTGSANLANVSLTGNIVANNITSNNRVSATNIKIGNSYIYSNTITTTDTNPHVICSFIVQGTDVYGVEYIVKSFDTSGGKYSMATVQAVTNGTNADYVTFATVRLGTTTGALSVQVGGSVGVDTSIELVATPSTSNSTVWTTQYRLI